MIIIVLCLLCLLTYFIIIFLKNKKIKELETEIQNKCGKIIEEINTFNESIKYNREQLAYFLKKSQEICNITFPIYEKIKNIKKEYKIQDLERVTEVRNLCFVKLNKINTDIIRECFKLFNEEKSKVKEEYNSFITGKNYLKESVRLQLNEKIKPVLEKKDAFLNSLQFEPNEFDKELFIDDIFEIDVDKKEIINNHFIETELENTNDFFSNIDGKSLDRQQKIAVITDEEANLVVAGAGSGKTLTISAKAKYLVKKGIKPEEILLITFTRNATNEMKERVQNKLNLPVTIKTFHKLGLDILKQNPDMEGYDMKETSEVISVKDIKNLIDNNETFKDNLFEYLVFYSTDNHAEVDFANKNEYYKSVDNFETVEGTIEKGVFNVLKNLKIQHIKSRKSYSSFNKEVAIESLSKGTCYDLIKEFIENKIPDSLFKIEKEEYDIIKEFIKTHSEKIKNDIFKNSYNDVTNNALNGTKVKSKEECAIANFLFLNGIEYEYEKVYLNNEFLQPKKNKNNYVRRTYKPDFYLPKYDIYIEHFGVDRNMKAHQYEVDENKKYEESMLWKRQVHELNRTKLLETYSFQYSEGILFATLKNQLEKLGVEFNAMTDEEINMYLDITYQNDSTLISFQNLFNTFLSLFKSNGYDKKTLEEFREKTKYYDPFLRRKHSLFFDLFEVLYDKYNDYLKEHNCIDFQDMIIESTKIINAPDFIPSEHELAYKYIIIDEFQDTSIARFKLVDAIRKANNNKTQIMVVGDDWQSIYRFAGSDIDLFTNFEKYFGISSRNFIEQTYRNSQQLLEVAGNFVMRNPKQIKKGLRSEKSLEQPVHIHSFNYDGVEDSLNCSTIAVVLSKILQGIEQSELYKNKTNIEVLILGRNKKDIENLNDGVLFKLEETNEGLEFKTKIVSDKIHLTFKTIHASKGLEADEVILLNVNDKKNGFPNKMEDDSVLSYVLSNVDDFLFAEERRLFYVALTRTKNHVHILTDIHKQSCFIEELENLPQVRSIFHSENNFEDMKCPRCGGRLIKRINRKSRSVFLGCENGGKGCEYTADFILESAFTKKTGKKDPRICPVCNSTHLKKSNYSEEFYCPGYLNTSEKVTHFKINKYELQARIVEFEKEKAEFEEQQQREADDITPPIKRKYSL